MKHPATGRPTATGTTVRVTQTIDPTKPDFAGPCPRCAGPIPNAAQPGAYPGAVSRVDNETYICSDCGTSEAMFQFTRRGVPLPPVNEPITY